MFSTTGRSAVGTITPSLLRQDTPLIVERFRPSATSFMVKSNSLRATKSMRGEALRLASGSTAIFAPKLGERRRVHHRKDVGERVEGSLALLGPGRKNAPTG